MLYDLIIENILYNIEYSIDCTYFVPDDIRNKRSEIFKINKGNVPLLIYLLNEKTGMGFNLIKCLKDNIEGCLKRHLICSSKPQYRFREEYEIIWDYIDTIPNTDISMDRSRDILNFIKKLELLITKN